MRQAAFAGLKPGLTTEDNNYFPLQYLALRCDQDALRELNRPANFAGSYPVACTCSGNIRSLPSGKCGYKDAIAHLVISLDAACVNNIDAAQHSLRQLLPHSTCWKKEDPKNNFQEETGLLRQRIKIGGTRPPPAK